MSKISSFIAISFAVLNSRFNKAIDCHFDSNKNELRKFLENKKNRKKKKGRK